MCSRKCPYTFSSIWLTTRSGCRVSETSAADRGAAAQPVVSRQEKQNASQHGRAPFGWRHRAGTRPGRPRMRIKIAFGGGVCYHKLASEKNVTIAQRVLPRRCPRNCRLDCRGARGQGGAEFTVRTLPCLAVSGLLVPAESRESSAPAAQTETLDNGAVTATFEDGALVRLRNAASNRVLELSGDSATLTVNGEKFAVPGRKLIATERRPDGVTFKYEAGDKQLQVIYELKPGWQFVSKQIRAHAAGGRHQPRGRRGGVPRQRENADRPRAQGQQRQRRGLPAPGRTELAAEVRRRSSRSRIRSSSGSATTDRSRWPTRPTWNGAPTYGPFDSDRVCLGLYALTGVEFPARNLRRVEVCPRAGTGLRGQPAARPGRVRRPDALRGRLRAVPPAEEPARPRAVVRERLPDRRGHARGPHRVEADHRPVRRRRRATTRCSPPPTATSPR